jgi:hypothetical protein
MEKRRIKMGFREEGEPQNKGKNEICKHGSSGEKRRQIRRGLFKTLAGYHR